jgi:hypothetical protein
MHAALGREWQGGLSAERGWGFRCMQLSQQELQHRAPQQSLYRLQLAAAAASAGQSRNHLAVRGWQVVKCNTPRCYVGCLSAIAQASSCCGYICRRSSWCFQAAWASPILSTLSQVSKAATDMAHVAVPCGSAASAGNQPDVYTPSHDVMYAAIGSRTASNPLPCISCSATRQPQPSYRTAQPVLQCNMGAAMRLKALRLLR